MEGTTAETVFMNALRDHEELADKIYACPPTAATALAEVRRLRDEDDMQASGYALEQLACHLFAGLRGVARMKSFKTYSAQLDLLIEGDETWASVTSRILELPSERQQVLVECKAIAGKVGVPEVAKFCTVVKQFPGCGLGVILTLKGVSGDDSKSCLKNGRLVQFLHLIESEGKCAILVLDEDQLEEIVTGQAGIPTAIRARRQQLASLRPSSTHSDPEVIEADLPGHLREAWKAARTALDPETALNREKEKGVL